MEDHKIKSNLSDLITELQDIEDKYGDMPVTINVLGGDWTGINNICVYCPTDEPILLLETDLDERTEITKEIRVYEQ